MLWDAFISLLFVTLTKANKKIRVAQFYKKKKKQQKNIVIGNAFCGEVVNLFDLLEMTL